MSSTGHWAFELPLLPLLDEVLLPYSQLQLTGVEGSAVAFVAEHVIHHHSMYIAAFSIKNNAEDTVWKTLQGPLYSIGCVARVAHVSHSRPETNADANTQKRYTLLLQGLLRCELQELTFKQDINLCVVHVLKPNIPNSREFVKVRRNMRSLLKQYIDKVSESAPAQKPMLDKLVQLVQHAPLEVLCNIALAVSVTGAAHRQELLESTDLIASAQVLISYLRDRLQSGEQFDVPDLAVIHLPARNFGDRLSRSRSEQEVNAQKREDDGNNGHGGDDDDDDGDDDTSELRNLQEQIERADLPHEARQTVTKELKRLKRLQPIHPEFSTIRSYLECMVELPWTITKPELSDIPEAKRRLDEDHYGLQRVKRRIVEFLAVMALRRTTSGSILCLVGPPGVGKTSLGRSVARAVGREFARVSLGGVHDEADIRGHRRTYVGAMPGNIIQAMRRVAVANPVILLDEVDKIGQSFKGDPSAALLEVLDPEQNHTFTDHYVNVPFDLSRVFFICTANQVEHIPAPLLDRMELVEIPGYTSEEKVHIAERYLLPKQLERSGLTNAHIAFSKDALLSLATEYTREAGVRQLERAVAALCRHVAVDVAAATSSDPTSSPTVEVDDVLLEEVLGPAKYHNEPAQQMTTPGVATGMATTPAGGELLFIECARVPGNGNVTITGQLGDVMQESVQIGLSWLRSRAALARDRFKRVSSEPYANRESDGISADDRNFDQLLSDAAVFESITSSDVHIHVPAGAIPKDGPSAGVAIVAALASLFTRRCVDPAVSMTGEVTLRGLVLPVGGVKNKVLAAHRGGIKRVLLPERNRRDLRDLPDDVLADITFLFPENIQQALEAALLPSSGQKQHHQQDLVDTIVNPRVPPHTLRSFY